MKNKIWIKYLIYILLVFVLVFLDGYIVRQQTNYREGTFNLSVTYFIISMIVKICIGSILGLEYIISEIKKDGHWKINFPKVLLMLLPSLYFSLSYFIYMANSVLANSVFIFMRNGNSFIYIFQIMLGYFLITSFYKESKYTTDKTID